MARDWTPPQQMLDAWASRNKAFAERVVRARVERASRDAVQAAAAKSGVRHSLKNRLMNGAR